MRSRRFYLKWLIPLSGILVIVFAIGLRPEAYPGLPDRVDYNYHIRPILSNNCYACHGPDVSTREANLRLDRFEDATAPLKDGGSAIVPGKPHKSRLIKRISSTNSDYRMPPLEAKKTLDPSQIALLERWIEQGAEWKPHWAFIKPVHPQLPRAIDGTSAAAVIDYLLDTKHVDRGLTVAAEAEASRLIRRLSYVLTGLPPSPEEIRDFVENTNLGIYENAVDQYLASPHFGERWARHWMDVIRYAESAGHEADAMIGGAWRYRDYLIRAFNEDLPYDQLVLEHLAGDLVESPRYHSEAGFNESILGTAFICLGEAKSFPVSLKQEETERINTMIDVTSMAFQALTVACARCHDHKFDPIPTTDYYAMYGMFAGARITPWPASMPQEHIAKLDNIEALKRDLQAWIEKQAPRKNDRTIHKASLELTNKNASLAMPDSVYRIMGDFRNGSWPGWSADGWAFGSIPVHDEPVFNRPNRQIQWVNSGYASSRKLVTGLSGALRSSNFVIEHDSLLIRARGQKGTLRVIIENYQPINALLYGGLHKFLEDPTWQDYTINVAAWKGYKAYIEFLPGIYNLQYHKLGPDDYIEIKYVVAFNGEQPDLSSEESTVPTLIRHSNIQRDAWTRTYDSLTVALYDSTHFVGLSRGHPVLNPVYNRGDYKRPSVERIPHGFLSAIKAGPADFPQDGLARLAWAQSVIDPENPLTSRIMVNRLWHYLFGTGLVETVDNFGVQGKLPSHPELLDYLALQFVEQGWSMKKMIKQMVMSQAFRRSTRSDSLNLRIDPENIYLHHYPVRRLEAEAIRDGVLAISGRLDSTMYGEPVPLDYTPFLSSIEEGNMPGISGPLDGAGRRSIYQTIRRNYLNPMMISFDMPVPYATVGQRNVSYTPTQSLSLLNDPFFHQQASHWAEDLLNKETTSVKSRIQDIYLRAFARPPSKIELTEAFAFLETQSQGYGQSLIEMETDARLWTDYCHSIFNRKEFIHLL